MESSLIDTRATTQNSDWFRLKLKQRGISTLAFPMIEIERLPVDPSYTRRNFIEQFKTVIFTSQNGVRHYLERLSPSIRARLGKKAVFCVGTHTREALAHFGISKARIPRYQTREGLGNWLCESLNLAEERILLIQGLRADGKLYQELSRQSRSCLRLDVYRTSPSRRFDEITAERIRNDRYGLIHFGSPSAVEGFTNLFKKENLSPLRISSVGPTTTASLETAGRSPIVVGDPGSPDDLIEKIAAFLSR